MKLYNMNMPIFKMSAKDFFREEILMKLPKVAFDGAVRAAEIYLASGVIALGLKTVIVFVNGRKAMRSVREAKKRMGAA